MKSQQIMIIITFLVAMTVIIDAFFVLPGLSDASTEIQNWGVIISACATGLASVNLFRIHFHRVMRRRGEYINSIALLIVLVLQSFIGIFNGSDSVIYSFGFDNLQTPLGATMYALLAFWIASAAYRAFTARSVDSGILLISATIVMLGNAPIGEYIWNQFPVMKAWIMNVPNMAAQRGIMIGAGVGAIALGIRILMGIERGHLGGSNE